MRKTELESVLSGSQSDAGRVVAFDNGLCVITDRVEVLTRIARVLDDLERVRVPVWVVQVSVVSRSVSESERLQFNVAPSVEIAATLVSSSSGPQVKIGSTGAAGLKGVLEAVRGQNGQAVVAEPLFVLADGEAASMHSGQRVPVPRRASDQHGNVSTVEFEYISTGFTCDVEVREESEQSCRLNTNITTNDIVRTVEGVPVTGGSELRTVSVLDSGGVYLIGEMREGGESVGRDGGLVFGQSTSKHDRVLQVWVRVYRIAGDAGAELAASGSSEPPTRAGGVRSMGRLPPVQPL
jgi:type II secretory pathway component GspD/PulD (secretin)